MRIRFNEISPHGSKYQVREVVGLDDCENFTVQQPVEAICNLQRKGDSKVELSGEVKARLTLSCDRCLKAFDIHIDTALQLLFEIADNSSWHVKELECSSTDLDTILLDEPVIDLVDVIRQQLCLSLPEKAVCSPTCKGICIQCGTDLNQRNCSCEGIENESPFAALARFKK